MLRLLSRWDNDLKGIYCLMIKKYVFIFCLDFFWCDVFYFINFVFLNVYLKVDYFDLRISYGVLNYLIYVIYLFK